MIEFSGMESLFSLKRVFKGQYVHKHAFSANAFQPVGHSYQIARLYKESRNVELRHLLFKTLR